MLLSDLTLFWLFLYGVLHINVQFSVWTLGPHAVVVLLLLFFYLIDVSMYVVK